MKGARVFGTVFPIDLGRTVFFIVRLQNSVLHVHVTVIYTGGNEWSEGLLHSFFIGQQYATDDCQATDQLGNDHFLPQKENSKDGCK